MGYRLVDILFSNQNELFFLQKKPSIREHFLCNSMGLFAAIPIAAIGYLFNSGYFQVLTTISAILTGWRDSTLGFYESRIFSGFSNATNLEEIDKLNLEIVNIILESRNEDDCLFKNNINDFINKYYLRDNHNTESAEDFEMKLFLLNCVQKTLIHSASTVLFAGFSIILGTLSYELFNTIFENIYFNSIGAVIAALPISILCYGACAESINVLLTSNICCYNKNPKKNFVNTYLPASDLIIPFVFTIIGSGSSASQYYIALTICNEYNWLSSVKNVVPWLYFLTNDIFESFNSALITKSGIVYLFSLFGTDNQKRVAKYLMNAEILSKLIYAQKKEYQGALPRVRL
jgi:hypothetical protein